MAGRLVMRLVAVVEGLRPGFSIGGTFDVILLGTGIGLAATMVYGLVRNRLPGRGLARGALFGIIVYLPFAAFPLPSARSAAAGVTHMALVYLAFALAFVGFGAVVEAMLSAPKR